MSDLTLNVDLTRMKPISCSAEFARLLGYRTRRGCLGGIERSDHIEGHNLLQLSVRARKTALPVMHVRDRDNRRVGRVVALRADATGYMMSIEITGHAAESRRAESVRQSDWNLLLDRELNIITVRHSLPAQVHTGKTERCWLTHILNSDRDRVRRVLGSKELPDPHTLYYRVVDAHGVIVVVRHDVTIHGPHLRGTVVVRPDRELALTRLQTIAIDAGIPGTGNPLVSLHAYPALLSLIPAVKSQLRQEVGDESLTLQYNDEHFDCDCCDVSSSGALVLTARRVRLLKRELAHLVKDDASMFGIGLKTGWRQALHTAHEHGLHFETGVNSEGQLRVAVWAVPG